MVDISDKIIKFFSKLNNYDVIREEKDYLVVTSRITICESKGISNNPMHPNILTKDKEFPIVFLVAPTNLIPKSRTIFQIGLPILKPEKQDLKSFENFERLLNQFMDQNFYFF